MDLRVWYLLEKSKMLCEQSGKACRAFDEKFQRAQSLLEMAEVIDARTVHKQLISQPFRTRTIPEVFQE